MARKTTPKQEAPPKPAQLERAPVSMSEELFADLLDKIANGSTLMRLAREDGFPSRSTIWAWISATEERLTAYNQARQDRADFRAEQLDVVPLKSSWASSIRNRRVSRATSSNGKCR
jgi:hypothetical protein